MSTRERKNNGDEQVLYADRGADMVEELMEERENENVGYVEVDIGDDLEQEIKLPEELMYTEGELDVTESDKLLMKYLKWENFADHHIKIYDNWLRRTSKKTIYGRKLKVTTDNDDLYVCFSELRISGPSVSVGGKKYELTPKAAREQGITYACTWHVDISLVRGNCNGEVIKHEENVCIASVPLMVKSHYCILNKKDRRQLALLGEDPDDQGGYFIIEGAERIVLLQEQLALNRIILMNVEKKDVEVRMTTSVPQGTALMSLCLDKSGSMIKIRLPSMRPVVPEKKVKKKKKSKPKSLNVLSIYRSMGIKSPKKIKGMIAMFIKEEWREKCMYKLVKNVTDLLANPNDEEIIGKKMGKITSDNDLLKESAKKVIDADLFPHLNNIQMLDGETEEKYKLRIQVSKLRLLSVMVARFLEYLAGYRELDNRDSWSIKRVEGAGRMMESLLRAAWKKTLGIAQDYIDQKGAPSFKDIVEKIRNNSITESYKSSFLTGKWGVKGGQVKNNVAQILVRDGVIATVSHVNTVDVSISRTDRQMGLRLVQPSQWGFICPVYTPEGENAGLLKNLAILARATVETKDEEIIRLLIGDADRKLKSRVNMSNPENDMQDKIIVNGKFIGWCNGEKTRNFLVKKRRNGLIHRHASVIKDDDWVYVDISPSRLVRPLLIVDPESQQLLIDSTNSREENFQTLFDKGLVEYLSPWEQEQDNIKIAPSVDYITKRLSKIDIAKKTMIAEQRLFEQAQDSGIVDDIKNAEIRFNSAKEDYETAIKSMKYTHCEIDPKAILSIAAACIPWPNHNQAPRNTYQVSMGKQALGIYHSNHKNRMGDGKIKVLAFPQRAIVETTMYEVIGLDKKASGENVTVAFMAYPYTEEDSFLFKKEFIENGGFRMFKYLTYKKILRLTGDVTDELFKPTLKENENPPDRYSFIQSGKNLEGLPQIGAPLRQGYCVLGIKQIIDSKNPTEGGTGSMILRVGDEGIVDKVQVTTDNKFLTVTVKLRIMWAPQEGDKFAPRNAQKGTCGLVLSDIDMPMTSKGISPDIIVNTHSIPSRMTMSYLLEILVSKAHAMIGSRINGGPFMDPNLKKSREILKRYGFNEMGYEKMRSGSSGRDLEAQIFCGPVYFQALRHQVNDKKQARGTGHVRAMTRQPAKGRGNRGGLRFGEMERDAVISHGCSAFLRERLMLVSDRYETAFCAICGTFAVSCDLAIGKHPKFRRCPICKNATHFGKAEIPYAYKYLIHLLGCFGINLRPSFMTLNEYSDHIFNNVSLDFSDAEEEFDADLFDADDDYEDTGYDEIYD